MLHQKQFRSTGGGAIFETRSIRLAIQANLGGHAAVRLGTGRSYRHDTASDRLAQVVAARDRDRTELPLDKKRLARLEIPVLLVHGVQDVVIPVSRTWELLNVIPHADAHIFSRCGHWSQVERAEEFNEVIGGYLARHGLAARP